MREKVSIDVMRKYIEQTQALDSERNQLVEQLQDENLPDNEADSILKRLDNIYHAQSANAIVLADMLSQVLDKTP